MWSYLERSHKNRECRFCMSKVDTRPKLLTLQISSLLARRGCTCHRLPDGNTIERREQWEISPQSQKSEARNRKRLPRRRAQPQQKRNKTTIAVFSKHQQRVRNNAQDGSYPRRGLCSCPRRGFHSHLSLTYKVCRYMHRSLFLPLRIIRGRSCRFLIHLHTEWPAF